MATNFTNIKYGVGIGSSASAPANPRNGDVYYDTTLNKFQKYENGTWGDLAANSTITRAQIAISTANSIVIDDATGHLSAVALTDGQLAIGSSTGAPAAGNITGTNITVTNGHNTIAISIPQSVATTATPTFASETLTATSNQLVLGTTNTTTISATAPAASRTYTVPDSGANSSFVMTDGTQTINGTKTFSGTVDLTNTNNVNLVSSSAIAVGDTTQSPATAGAGAIRFHTSTLQFSDGSAWNTLTSGNFVAGNTGDIGPSTATAVDNTASPTDVTGLDFSNASVTGFEVLLTIVRGTTYAKFSLEGIQKAASWEMSQTFVGDDTGVDLTITAAGQVQYTTTSTGTDATLKFRALAL